MRRQWINKLVWVTCGCHRVCDKIETSISSLVLFQGTYKMVLFFCQGWKYLECKSTPFCVLFVKSYVYIQSNTIYDTFLIYSRISHYSSSATKSILPGLSKRLLRGIFISELTSPSYSVHPDPPLERSVTLIYVFRTPTLYEKYMFLGVPPVTPESFLSSHISTSFFLRSEKRPTLVFLNLSNIVPSLH